MNKRLKKNLGAHLHPRSGQPCQNPKIVPHAYGDTSGYKIVFCETCFGVFQERNTGLFHIECPGKKEETQDHERETRLRKWLISFLEKEWIKMSDGTLSWRGNWKGMQFAGAFMGNAILHAMDEIGMNSKEELKAAIDAMKD